MTKKWLVTADCNGITTWVFDDKESAIAKFRKILDEDIADEDRESFEDYVKQGKYYDGDDYDLILYESEDNS